MLFNWYLLKTIFFFTDVFFAYYCVTLAVFTVGCGFSAFFMIVIYPY